MLLRAVLSAVYTYSFVAVSGSFWLRARLGQHGWCAVHLLSFPAFGLVTLHGLLAGTDGGAPWLRAVYLGAVVLVGTLIVVRLLSWAGPVLRRAPWRAEA